MPNPPPLAPPDTVHTARNTARALCRVHRIGQDRCQALTVVVSELVGNAIRHGRPPITYDVSVDGPDLLVSVHDNDPRPPGDGQDPEPGAESGRGLLLVAALSRLWGWSPAPGGKRVWARL